MRATRSLARPTAAVTALALVAGALSFFSAVPAAAQDSGADALGELATCVTNADRLEAVFLIDESQSLQESDPDSSRVRAVRSALGGLTSLGQVAESLDVDVLVATFASELDVLVDWTTLDRDSRAGVSGQVDGLDSRWWGLETDYAAALFGARELLTERVAGLDADGQTSCEVIFWFTDGGWAVADLGIPKAYAGGRSASTFAEADELFALGLDAVCAPGGIADQFRRDGVTVLALGAGSMPDWASAQLGAIAEGQAVDSGDELVCGTHPLPAGHTPGAYLAAGDVEGLADLYRDALRSLRGGTEGPTGQVGCSGCEYVFPVDPGITGVDIYVTDATGTSAEITTPGGEVVSIPIGESVDTTVAGVDISGDWLEEGSVIAQLSLPPAHSLAGDWTVTLVGASTDAVASVDYFVDIEPVFATEPEFQAGEAGPIVVALEHADGSPVDVGDYGEVAVSVEIGDPRDGSREQVDVSAGAGEWSGEWTPPVDDFPSRVRVQSTVRLTTASGIELAPVSRSVEVSVAPPPAYPSVTPGHLDLASITGSGESTAELVVVASDIHGGCVWIEGATLTGTSTTDGVALSTAPRAGGQADCLRLEPGQTRSIDVRVETSDAVDGRAVGTVAVGLLTDAQDEVVFLEVPVEARLWKPIDQAQRAGVTAAMIAAGILLPFAFMYLVGWRGARFVDPSELKVASIPIRMRGERVDRVDDPTNPGSLTLGYDDFTNVGDGQAERPRHFDTHGASFRARIRLNPFAAPRGTATTGGPVGSNHRSGVSGDASSALVPLGLAGTWLVTYIGTSGGEQAVDPSRPVWERDDQATTEETVDAVLRVYVSATDAPAQRAALEDDLRRRLPSVLNKLAEASVDGPDHPAPVATPSEPVSIGAPRSTAFGGPTTAPSAVGPPRHNWD